MCYTCSIMDKNCRDWALALSVWGCIAILIFVAFVYRIF